MGVKKNLSKCLHRSTFWFVSKVYLCHVDLFRTILENLMQNVTGFLLLLPSQVFFLLISQLPTKMSLSILKLGNTFSTALRYVKHVYKYFLLLFNCLNATAKPMHFFTFSQLKSLSTQIYKWQHDNCPTTTTVQRCQSRSWVFPSILYYKVFNSNCCQAGHDLIMTQHLHLGISVDISYLPSE